MDIAGTIRHHLEVIQSLEKRASEIAELAAALWARLDAGGRIFWMGNGGSAADSQHLAAELVGRYARERRGLPSIALTTDSSALTSIANDYGYDAVFSRQIEALCTPADAVIGISTSGNSPNVVQGIRAAREAGTLTVGLTGGDGGELARLAERCFTVDSPVTARVQEAHILIGHLLCDWIEEKSVG